MNVAIRRLVLSVLYGIAVIMRWLKENPDPAVLVYHSIDMDKWFFSVTPAMFDHQMKYLRSFCNPVSLSDIVDSLKNNSRLPPRSVAITFDDGYEDFIYRALPILEKYHIPATLFVLAGPVDHSQLGTERPLIHPSRWRELLSKSRLIQIGSHAVSHRKLSRLGPEELRHEVEGSKSSIEKEIESQVDFLAYPKGNFNKTVMDAAHEAGYKGAVTVVQRLVKKGDSFFAIPRIQVDSSHSFEEFKMRLSPAINWYFGLWQKLKG